MAFHVQCHTLCILVTNLLQISIFKYSIEYREYMYIGHFALRDLLFIDEKGLLRKQTSTCIYIN